MSLDYDALVIGGGFYGTVIANHLAKKTDLKRVLLVERERELFSCASYKNQARVHGGYHYPRSFTTAYRARINLPKFLRDWPSAVNRSFTKLYALARINSKVTAHQFERFCQQIGATLRAVDASHRELFNPLLIENVFCVEEYAFDATKLSAWATAALKDSRVHVELGTNVTALSKIASGIKVQLADHSLTSRYVFNCAYSGLNQHKGDFPSTMTPLKHELAELALIKVPPALEHVGVTVMDGPFFSLMPFPSQNVHTLSHVRYTPHMEWEDQPGLDPYQKIKDYKPLSRVDRMMRDAGRYMPSVLEAKYQRSLFEVKTVLVKNETDDGRPILFEKHIELPGCYSILGGKLDNVYDVLEKLDAEFF